MKLSITSLKKLVLLLGIGFLFSTNSFAQVKYASKSTVSVVVSGTSTLHDWDMKSSSGNFEGMFTLNAANAITAVTNISFSTTGEALKSGHGAMDKNAYKALKTDKSNTISFLSSSASVSPIDASNFLVKANGKLTVAGKTLDTDINATCRVNADKSITIMASKKISMKDYAMEPPSFMMGTIKTGNDVTLKFDFNIAK
ncbi:MAG: YceI family protein [Sphingobacteriia bacterium]|jgi:polyisoprenoid-binding protein YceI